LEAAYCAEINMAAARTYAVNAGAPFAFATVGNSRFLDSQGLDITVVKASASFDTVPLVYVSFDTASLAQTVPYATDGEQSWGILQLINAGFPSYILKVRGNYVQRHIVSTSKLIAG
jgi:hypothetical protein